jgi:drug/metabolite transporter (DMT)-like permease
MHRPCPQGASMLSRPLAILIMSQLLFTAGDLLARAHVKDNFTVANLLTGWFAAYLVLRTVAMFGQLYVLSIVEIGRTIALFGASSIVVSNVLGWMILREVLSPITYVGISLAVLAFLILSWQ